MLAVVYVVAHYCSDAGHVPALLGRRIPFGEHKGEKQGFSAPTSRASSTALSAFGRATAAPERRARQFHYIRGVFSSIRGLLSAGFDFCAWPRFFPKVDAGQIRITFARAPGLRIEVTGRVADQSMK